MEKTESTAWTAGSGLLALEVVHFDHGFANAMGHAGDACELPDGRWMTKQSFWFNKGYLEHILGL